MPLGYILTYRRDSWNSPQISKVYQWNWMQLYSNTVNRPPSFSTSEQGHTSGKKINEFKILRFSLVAFERIIKCYKHLGFLTKIQGSLSILYFEWLEVNTLGTVKRLWYCILAHQSVSEIHWFGLLPMNLSSHVFLKFNLLF